MKKLLLLLTAALAVGGLLYAEFAAAQTATSTPAGLSAISYPIAELGNCGSQSECKAYCEEDANKSACLSYAQAHNLMSAAQVAAAKIIIAKKGPGGCSDASSCREYCADSSHTDECASFATTHNLIASTTAAIIKTIASGGGPGGCDSRAACMSYCSYVSHIDECKAFAQDNGLTPRIEAHMGSSTQPLPGRIGSTSPSMHPFASSSVPATAKELINEHRGDTGAASGTPPRASAVGSSTVPAGATQNFRGEGESGNNSPRPVPGGGTNNGFFKPFLQKVQNGFQKGADSAASLGADIIGGFESLRGL